MTLSDTLTLADIDRIKASLKPLHLPFVCAENCKYVIVVATDEQIAQAELDGFLRIPDPARDTD